MAASPAFPAGKEMICCRGWKSLVGEWPFFPCDAGLFFGHGELGGNTGRPPKVGLVGVTLAQARWWDSERYQCGGGLLGAAMGKPSFPFSTAALRSRLVHVTW